MGLGIGTFCLGVINMGLGVGEFCLGRMGDGGVL